MEDTNEMEYFFQRKINCTRDPIMALRYMVMFLDQYAGRSDDVKLGN
jgi:hypothetical protein